LKLTIEQLAARISRPDLRGAFWAAKTFPKAVYDAAITTFWPQFQQLGASYFAADKVIAIRLRTTPPPAPTL
jgi:hypothetical protein